MAFIISSSPLSVASALLALYVVEGRIITKMDRIGRVLDGVEVSSAAQSHATSQGQEQESEPQAVQHLSSRTADGGTEHCTLQRDAEGAVTLVDRRMICPRYGYLYDVVFGEQLAKHRKKKLGTEEDQEAGKEKVSWSIWIRLDAPVLEEGFRMSRVSTTISSDIPGLELKFSLPRLKELEANAERFLPNATEHPANPDRQSLCSRQLNRYLFYILGKNNGKGAAPLVTEDEWSEILWRIVMWLFTGNSDPNIKGHFIPVGRPVYRVSSPQDDYPPWFFTGLWPESHENQWALF
ncbi:hypothetical protein FOZ63_024416 [Perkinsus olseni]|uniref:Uncharacterized protein n=1 Tax=Perkinsus olseni TaxID=32597 RepID=A0A7J6SM24_PEROL|nr:hypothetical protein FOZ63_024416 [Perkinsus olseni]